MRLRIGPLDVSFNWRGREYNEIEEMLKRNDRSRKHYGALYQDFRGQIDGEIFLGNMTEERAAALPLHTLRSNGLAHDIRVGLPKNVTGVFEFGYFVQTRELTSLGIRYKF